MPLRAASASTVLGERQAMDVGPVERHEHRVEVEPAHRIEQDGRVVVAGQAEEPHAPLVARLDQGLERAAAAEDRGAGRRACAGRGAARGRGGRCGAAGGSRRAAGASRRGCGRASWRRGRSRDDARPARRRSSRGSPRRPAPCRSSSRPGRAPGGSPRPLQPCARACGARPRRRGRTASPRSPCGPAVGAGSEGMGHRSCAAVQSRSWCWTWRSPLVGCSSSTDPTRRRTLRAPTPDLLPYPVLTARPSAATKVVSGQ